MNTSNITQDELDVWSDINNPNNEDYLGDDDE